MTDRVPYTAFCRISYWKSCNSVSGRHAGYIACDPTDDWDRCDVEPLSTYSFYGTMKFTKDQKYERDALLYLLRQAFDAGECFKLRHIQAVLGISNR